MSAAETAPAPTSVASPSSANPAKDAFEHSEALQRIAAVPLVSDSLSFAQSAINAHPLLAHTYQFGQGAFNSSLKAASPITSRLHPQLAYVDSLAVKSLDFAESRWSYPFHANANELIEAAKTPADQARNLVQAYAAAIQQAYGERVYTPAKAAYDAHVVPAYEGAHTKFDEIKSQNAYLQRATDVVRDLQANLAKTVESISSRGKQEGDQATQKAQGISNALFAELDRVRAFASNLPDEGRKRVGPVLETFTETYERLSKEARNPDVPATTRFVNVLKFVREQSLPALQKAILHPSSAANGTSTTATTEKPATNGSD
ncbi:uncharacterized protein PFL1_06061 [Pseudozyma flocculosa PF-1]|uniref:Lipid droplet-associated perilipin protein n=2 Tax=Pseudozyma flocculosa TaxID=84751 RepID=A0A5C3F3B2_9BASI|nr:uncharacterized protein PFL1_06061 [Pseudozyma flocculosa PF-1]EPQ26413.1 hypothetical protein PFL1_06061 [Pseudozyma flocculosa PF-1]SPO38993.1 uncharacterized protein PSFLO_04472 [Pseudozyma flocculosa]